MSDSECVIFAFGTLREAADAVFRAVEPECFAASGDDLMGIGLMADIKDELVRGGIEYIVESDDQFYGAEAWSEMSGIDGAAFDHVLADFSA